MVEKEPNIKTFKYTHPGDHFSGEFGGQQPIEDGNTKQKAKSCKKCQEKSTKTSFW